MTCGETKSMYMSCFGIAPYLQDSLLSKLKKQPFVLSFDETLNRDLQKKQLDIILRHWDNNTVSSSYFTSDFLGHACATDLVKSFEATVEAKTGVNPLYNYLIYGRAERYLVSV